MNSQFFVNGGFSDTMNVGCLILFEEFLSPFQLVIVITVNSQQNIAVTDFGFIQFGFVFRNTQSYERAGDTTDGGTNCGATASPCLTVAITPLPFFR
jgi:hypothetical protein